MEHSFDLTYTKIKIYGRECVQNRATSYYGDVDFYYSGQTMPKKEMPIPLRELMDTLNQQFQINFNSCLVNYYPDGNSNIGRHSDGVGYRLGSNNSVATISLGSSRLFQFRNRKDSNLLSDDGLIVQLDNGDLVIMYNQCQQYTTHSILKDKRITTPRISLTFRELL